MKSTIILIDHDCKRRAVLSFMLRKECIHVEPFENVAELGQSWPTAETLMIFDKEGEIASAAERMTVSSHWLPIVAYATDPTPRRIADAIIDGAVDYVEWPGDRRDVVEAIRDAKGRALARSTNEKRAREAGARARLETLSKREQEVLAGVTEGLSNRLIGRKLGISARTVEIHRAHVLEKIGARSSSEAIRMAVEAGFTLDTDEDRWKEEQPQSLRPAPRARRASPPRRNAAPAPAAKGASL